MKYKLDGGAHSVYALQYHLVQCVKYRRQVFDAIKTITSRKIKRNFPEVKQKLWGEAFRSPSYFLATSGQATLEQLKRYADGQGEPDAAN